MRVRRAAAGVLTGCVAATCLGLGAAPAPGAESPPVRADRLDPLGAGALAAAAAVRPVVADVGGFRVSVTARRLVVRDPSGATALATAPGRAYVAASRSALAVGEHRGYLWPAVTRTARLDVQTLASVRVSPAAVVLAGTLAEAPGTAGARPAAGATWRMTLSAVRRGGARLLAVDVRTAPAAGSAPVDSVQVSLGRAPGEAVSGFGMQYRAWDLSGATFPLLHREQGVGRGEQPLTGLADATNDGAGGTLAMTYAAWPAWLTSAGRAGRVVGAAAGAVGTVDLRDASALRLELRAPAVALELVGARTPAAALVRRDAGRTRLAPPAWSGAGAVLGVQGGTAAVRRKVAAVRAAGTPVAAVWIQDWVGRRTTSFGDRLWWTWQPDASLYPGWDALVDELGRAGAKVLTYVNPMLTDASAKRPAPARNLYAEAARAGYLVRRADGTPYVQDQGEFGAAMVDLTRPAARAWYARVVARYVLAGKVAGFMADFGEGLPFDAVLAAGSGARWHQTYPLLWARTVRDACRLAGRPDCLVFLRSGTDASAAASGLFWAGDQMVGFAAQDGLPSALDGMLAAGASGWPFVHSDVGGYTSVGALSYVRPAELLARWAQMEAFGVVLRTHEGNRPAANLQVYSDRTQAAAFARAARIFAALAPYRAAVVAEGVRTGLPALRHPSLVVPGTATARARGLFFLGAHLLVAPVLAEGARSVRVPLPPGRWQHALTGAVYAGGRTVAVPAPLDTPAAFVRVGDPVGAGIRAALRAAV